MRLWLDVALVDDAGCVHGRIRRRVSDKAAYMGPRAQEWERIHDAIRKTIED